MADEINFYIREEPYGWLSNFERTPFTLDGIMYYPTNEHFYQSQKAFNPAIQEWIRTASNAWLAMKAGCSLREGKELRGDWQEIKLKIMYKGLQAKFKNPELREKLLLTGDLPIHEDSPDDYFWGKKGQDWLGKLLCKVRDELRNQNNIKQDYVRGGLK